jgi:hypothetical protein
LSDRNATWALPDRPGADGGERSNIIILEEHRMYRLPQHDRKGGAIEHAAFLALNAAALFLVGITLCDGARFAAGREEIGRVVAADIRPFSAERASVAQQQPPAGLKPTQQTAGVPKLREPKS